MSSALTYGSPLRSTPITLTGLPLLSSDFLYSSASETVSIASARLCRRSMENSSLDVHQKGIIVVNQLVQLHNLRWSYCTCVPDVDFCWQCIESRLYSLHDGIDVWSLGHTCMSRSCILWAQFLQILQYLFPCTTKMATVLHEFRIA